MTSANGAAPVAHRIPSAVNALLAAIVVAMTLYVCGRLAFGLMFSAVQPYDDEGASLIVLDQLAQGHTLYDQVTTMYGPIGFLPKLALVKLLHLPVNHDTGRALTLVYWLVTCALLGIAAWRLGGSPAWFALGTLTACITLTSIINEPGHPQDVCGLLLAVAVTVCAIVKRGATTSVVVILAILGGLLTMTKINLGAFYVAALGTAMLCHMPLGRLRWWLAGGLAILLFSCPFALMHGNFDREWVPPYAWEVSLSLIACLVIAVTVPSKPQLKPSHLLWCAGAFVLTIFAVATICMTMGTSLAGLAQGVIFLPMRLSSSFFVPAPTNDKSITIAAVGLVLATATAWLIGGERKPQPILLAIGLLRVAMSSVTIYYVSRFDREHVLSSIPGFIWLLLLPVQRRTGSPDFFFARLFLSFLALFESMWAFPVAGSQLAFALFLPVLVAVITLADGIGNLTGLISRTTVGDGIRRIATNAILVVTLYGGWIFADGEMAQYRSLVSLDFRGSHWIHLPASRVRAMEMLVTDLQLNADVFYTAPGLNSLYFWTQMSPPTSANVTGWMYILSDAQQKQVISVLQSHTRPCFVYVPNWAYFWTKDLPQRQGPLLNYFHANFRLAYKLGGAELWVLKDRSYVDLLQEDGTVHREPLTAEARR